MLFHRASQRYGQSPAPVTPFQKAEQLWDERMGAARAQAHNWRLMAFCSFALSFGLSLALVWQSLQTHIVPYVVEINTFGEVKTVAPAVQNYVPSDAQIAWHLAQFISHVRSISTDPVLVREHWLSAYDYATDKAVLFLGDFARKTDPFAQIGSRSISVQVTSVTRASENSFQVKWVEQTYERGALASTERWTAILSLITRPPQTEDQLRKNPLGLFITAIDWSHELDTPSFKIQP